MVHCLEEIVEAASGKHAVPTLFRSMKPNGTPDYHGLVVWTPAQHAIHLACNSADWRAKKVVAIQWAKYKRTKGGKLTSEVDPEMVGTQQDLETCMKVLVQWVEEYGGPNKNGPTQWYVDQVEKETEKQRKLTFIIAWLGLPTVSKTSAASWSRVRSISGAAPSLRA